MNRADAHVVALWDAINAYVTACGGDPSAATISGRRMDAVAQVEAARSVLVHNVDDGTSRRVPLPPVPVGQRPALAAVCWKHEETPDGVGAVGPVWFRDTLGVMTRAPRWFERPRAQEMAEKLGVEFIET